MPKIFHGTGIYIYPYNCCHIFRGNQDRSCRLQIWPFLHMEDHPSWGFFRNIIRHRRRSLVSTAWFLRRRAAWFHRGRRWRVSEAKFLTNAAAEWRWYNHHTRNTETITAFFFAPESMMGIPSSEFLRVWKRGLFFFGAKILVSGRVLFMYRDCVMWVFRFV